MEIKELRKLFEEYDDCTFVDVESPESNQIAEILSEEGVLSRFDKDGN